jgi:type I restriction enzyme, S subunit
MGNERPTVTLRDANVSLIDCEHRTPPASSAGYPYIAIPQIQNGRIDLSDVRRITREHFTEWTRKAMPQPYDVVLSRRCNPGETAFVPPGLECALGQNLVLLRADGSKVFPPFLRWLVRGDDWWEQISKFLNHGAVFESLKCADIPSFELPLPSLEEQQAIAQLLGALDDKIELNRQINHTLEEMAGALYRAWFVDFEPVVARAAGRSPFGLAPEVAALFPGAFTDSELGPVPEGWRSCPIKQMYRAMFDGPHATPPDSESGPVFLGISNLTGTRIDLEEARYISEADYPRWTKRVTPDHLDIVFTYEATIGFCALMSPDLRCCLGRRLALVRAHAGTEHFLFHSMVAAPFQELLAARVWSGSTVDRIPLTEFPDYPMLWPGETLAKAFDAVVKPWWRMIHHNQTESQTLTRLRDALLPKLLSGEVRVKHAERVLEKA